MLAILGAVAVALSVSQRASADTAMTLNPSHINATNPGFEVGTCPTPPAGQEGWFGWHFINPSENFTSLTVTFQNAGTFSADPFPGTVFVSHPHGSHAYIWTPTADTLLSASGTSDGTNTQFNLSHVCAGNGGDDPQAELTVVKTANTSFTRTHDWSIEKSVTTENEYEHNELPKIWLYTDDSGDETASWTVEVTYEGYTDSDWAVSGVITITNSGDVDVTVTSIVDDLGIAGLDDIDLTCTVGLEEDPFVAPADLAEGAVVTCTYSEALSGAVPGTNTVTVGFTSELDGADTEVATANWTFVGATPTTVVNATVNVSDLSDLFGAVALGSVTAPNGATFTYYKDFTFAGFAACGDYSYGNTATIVETGQSASATLLVNVQCYVYETAFGKAQSGGDTCFIADGFSRWGWTNRYVLGSGPQTYDLWAAAGQCETSKGTLVGTVTVSDAGGYVTVVFNVDPEYDLQETHVYVGTTKYPTVTQGKKTSTTVAPGQYTNNSPFAPNATVWVIAHAVVGLPDPDFGP